MNAQLVQDRNRRFRTGLYICILLALLALLVAASYTWLSISKTPRVSDMDVYISGQTGLELAKTYNAPDEEWGQVLDFKEIVGVETQLKPATWSQREGRMMTITYGTDGRMAGVYAPLTDEQNANRKDGDGYYVKGTFYARQRYAGDGLAGRGDRGKRRREYRRNLCHRYPGVEQSGDPA